uniref:J domain-containing protein n=1 Tax=Kalanchoe fedtschenkoi TaxID=63787 RepID=A0A7N0T5F0_KALFE
MSSVAGLNCRRLLQSVPVLTSQSTTFTCHFALPSCGVRRRFSTGSLGNEFGGINAYDLLQIPETSSFEDVKASFRKLAKETHPDVAGAKTGAAASQRFVEILAAYEILSDREKRAHYDRYLLSQRKILREYSRQGSRLYVYESHMKTIKPMEVVEWLRWYRLAVKDILAAEKNLVVGAGYFDVLEHDFYSAVRAAYYGPVIEDWDLLPDCFEAEERSYDWTPEVLHLVSGRDLFGKICVVDRVDKIQQSFRERLEGSTSSGSQCNNYVNEISNYMDSQKKMNDQDQLKTCDYRLLDPYADLELHLSGRVVAVATRVPPKRGVGEPSSRDALDHIHVYLIDEGLVDRGARDLLKNGVPMPRTRLGTITGLGTNPEEGSCDVYNRNGNKTHVIMKHRTLLVRHMHWYRLGDEVSVCECRCSRARLPPSRFWLFEPRCDMHDIGGWYIETYGRDKKGRTVPSRRYWDVFDSSEGSEKRLHPAVYLLGTAYRTLDIEESRRRKPTWRSAVEQKLGQALEWGKQLVQIRIS